jgi:PadR family transcriptional regulator PadR
MLPLPLLPGTLDLLVLKAASWRAEHGYGIARRIEDRSDGALRIEEGALYQALHRLEHRGALSAEWGTSDNGRRAKFYRLTAEGRELLRRESSAWRRYSAAISTVLDGA